MDKPVNSLFAELEVKVLQEMMKSTKSYNEIGSDFDISSEQVEYIHTKAIRENYISPSVMCQQNIDYLERVDYLSLDEWIILDYLSIFLSPRFISLNIFSRKVDFMTQRHVYRFFDFISEEEIRLVLKSLEQKLLISRFGQLHNPKFLVNPHVANVGLARNQDILEMVFNRKLPYKGENRMGILQFPIPVFE